MRGGEKPATLIQTGWNPGGLLKSSPRGEEVAKKKKVRGHTDKEPYLSSNRSGFVLPPGIVEGKTKKGDS